MIKTIIEGSFIVQVFRDGVEIIKTKRTKNLILAGKMETSSDFGDALHIGTGSTVPTFNDTVLDSFLLSSPLSSPWVAASNVLIGTDYNKESSKVFSFALGAVVGNLTELGIASGVAEGSDLHTRALFKDGIGDPTTITVTALDQLVVTYFVKKTSSMVTTTSSVSATVDGLPVTIDYTIRPCISSSGDGGSDASFPSSIYKRGTSNFLRMTVNDANRITVNPVTFVPSTADSDGDIIITSDVLTLTGTGSTITYTATYPISSGNFQWVSATFADNASSATSQVLFQIEFDGPNFITKVNTETVTFSITEIVDQVV